jgi:hypothetical protein
VARSYRNLKILFGLFTSHHLVNAAIHLVFNICGVIKIWMVHGDYCIKATSGVEFDYPKQNGFCIASYSFWFTAQLLLIININSKARFLWKAVYCKIDIFAVT